MNGSTQLSLSWRKTFAALSHPNYRLWFVGQMVSLFGTWMQIAAQGYLVYELTRSAAWLGYTGFASGMASWLFMLWGGVVADRVSRRSVLVATQAASMCLAVLLSILTFTRTVAPWHIIGLAFLLGVVNAFDAPARQAFVFELVDRRDLTNAIALNSTMFNSAMVVGPALGGIVYALVGPGWCFALNGVSFIAVIAALLLMRLPASPPRSPHSSAITAISEGFRELLGKPAILAIIVLIVAFSLFGMSFLTLMPAWAVKILGGDSRTNGLLQSARGLGALITALGIASLGHFGFRGRFLTISSLAAPLALLAFSFTRILPLSLAALFVVGATNIVVMNLANSLVQTETAEAVRGRVMAIYTLCFFGFQPIGSLLAGTLAQRASEPFAVAVCALAGLACSVAIALAAPMLRRMR